MLIESTLADATDEQIEELAAANLNHPLAPKLGVKIRQNLVMGDILQKRFALKSLAALESAEAEKAAVVPVVVEESPEPSKPAQPVMGTEISDLETLRRRVLELGKAYVDQIPESQRRFLSPLQGNEPGWWLKRTSLTVQELKEIARHHRRAAKKVRHLKNKADRAIANRAQLKGVNPQPPKYGGPKASEAKSRKKALAGNR